MAFEHAERDEVTIDERRTREERPAGEKLRYRVGQEAGDDGPDGEAETAGRTLELRHEPRHGRQGMDPEKYVQNLQFEGVEPEPSGQGRHGQVCPGVFGQPPLIRRPGIQRRDTLRRTWLGGHERDHRGDALEQHFGSGRSGVLLHHANTPRGLTGRSPPKRVELSTTHRAVLALRRRPLIIRPNSPSWTRPAFALRPSPRRPEGWEGDVETGRARRPPSPSR